MILTSKTSKIKIQFVEGLNRTLFKNILLMRYKQTILKIKGMNGNSRGSLSGSFYRIHSSRLNLKILLFKPIVD